jgi:hypothetical protein
MFRKKTTWYRATIKALLFSGVIYKIALMFLKSTEGNKRKKKENRADYDVTNDLRMILAALRTLQKTP